MNRVPRPASRRVSRGRSEWRTLVLRGLFVVACPRLVATCAIDGPTRFGDEREEAPSCRRGDARKRKGDAPAAVEMTPPITQGVTGKWQHSFHVHRGAYKGTKSRQCTALAAGLKKETLWRAGVGGARAQAWCVLRCELSPRRACGTHPATGTPPSLSGVAPVHLVPPTPVEMRSAFVRVRVSRQNPNRRNGGWTSAEMRGTANGPCR